MVRESGTRASRHSHGDVPQVARGYFAAVVGDASIDKAALLLALL
jgi:hypothetical protein